eukprot:8976939-Ditylum_brightwellii.AAC.1
MATKHKGEITIMEHMTQKFMLHCFPQYFDTKRPPQKQIDTDTKKYLLINRAYCIKPAEDWQSICLYGVQPLLSHKEIEQLVNHDLVKMCHYSQSYTDNTMTLTIYSSRVFTIDKDLAVVVPSKHRTKDFMI